MNLIERRRGMMQALGDNVIITLYDSDFAKRVGNNNVYPYYSKASQRVLYTDFDLALEGGHRYRFEAIVNYSTTQMALYCYTQNTLDKVTLQTDISNTYYDSGWQSTTCEIDVPATYNGSPVVGLRLTMRQSTSNPIIANDFTITKFTVTLIS